MAVKIPFFEEPKFAWRQPQDLPNRQFICGYCNTTVSSIKGYKIGANSDASGAQLAAVYICPNCRGPAFADPDKDMHPAVAFGSPVSHVPEALSSLYEEGRRCTSARSYTGAVLICRKMLMNIAVQEGAKEGDSFFSYVTYLADKGYVPPNGRHWVDHIRKRGNEATHEIVLMGENDAKELLGFVEMLLRFIYEFPNMIPKQPAQP